MALCPLLGMLGQSPHRTSTRESCSEGEEYWYRQCRSWCACQRKGEEFDWRRNRSAKVERERVSTSERKSWTSALHCSLLGAGEGGREGGEGGGKGGREGGRE